jgi:putative thioredoxin
MEVTTENFQSVVIERSHELPVVVDFWADWCAPCRQLGPVLEQAVQARAGQIELVKVDTDANQQLAIDYRIQSIPAVKAFRDGKVAAEFVGAQPPAAVEQFLDSLLPSEAEVLTAQGGEASLRQALALEPARADAAVPLAKLLYARGELDEALTVLAPIDGSFAADGLRARIELVRAEQPDLSTAFAALDGGDADSALDELLGALPAAGSARDTVRRAIVGILDELGTESELARSARRRLATALY